MLSEDRFEADAAEAKLIKMCEKSIRDRLNCSDELLAL